MNFYEHRFDFLRVASTSFNPMNAPSIEGLLSGAETYCLPVKKQTITIPNVGTFTLGEDNIVECSTCFFINTGDLFIYKKIGSSEFPDSPSYAWVKVSGMSDDNQGIYEETDQYINPYYDDSGNVG